MTFTPKTALITGAASGMGRVMATRMAQAGVQVVAVDLNEAALAALVEAFPTITPIVCNVADDAQVVAAVKAANEAVGPIDRMVHCAALMPGGRIDEVSVEDITRLMRVNYDGTVSITKAVLPSMQARRTGEIVIFGSTAGMVFAERLGAYNATKAAVNAYAEVLAHEVAAHNVHVLLVAPPLVRTPLVDQLKETGPGSVLKVFNKGGGMEPEAVVDCVEKALRKRKHLVLPREAKAVYAGRRISPALMWWVMKKMG